MNLAWPVATPTLYKGSPHNRRGSNQNVRSTNLAFKVSAGFTLALSADMFVQGQVDS
jgi:hypothetical protein